MKKSMLWIACIMLCLNVFAQTGVHFQELAFADALAKAKAEKKLVFVDCYTSWCGPCKTMTSQVFPDPRVGEVINAACISVKFDMEKGEGKELAEKYNVKNFPTYLIFKSDGTLQHRAASACFPDDLIPKLHRWFNPKTSFAYLDKRNQKGKLNNRQKLCYILSLKDALQDEAAEKLAKEVLPTLTEKDKLTPAYWEFIAETEYGEMTRFARKHAQEFYDLVGEDIVKNKLKYKYHERLNVFSEAYELDDPSRIDALKKEMDEVANDIRFFNFDNSESMLWKIRLSRASLQKDMNGVLQMLGERTWNDENLDENHIKIIGIRMVLEKGTESEKKQLLAMKEQLTGGKNNTLTASLLADLEKEFTPGVHFEEITYAEALAKAKKEGKFVFVDCYTTWCGPCRWMTKNVLPTQKVGDVINTNCVSIECNMDKKELRAPLDAFDIHAYPTYLIVTPNGKLRHRIIGAMDADTFVSLLQDGFSDTRNYVYLDKLYREGKCGKEELLYFWRALSNLSILEEEREAIVRKELFDCLSDEERVEAKYWPMLSYNPNPRDPKYGDDYFYFILKHADALKTSVGKKVVEDYLYQVYDRQMELFFFNLRCHLDEMGKPQEVKAELAQMRHELETYDVGNTDTLLYYLDWAEKGYDRKIPEIMKFLKGIKLEKTEKILRVAYGLYSVVAQSGSEADKASLDSFYKELYRLVCEQAKEKYKALKM